MMKFQAAIATGLGAFVLVPSALLGDQEVAALENALAETTRAIEVLAGIREQTLTQPETAFGLVASATEAPILDPMQRDDRLVALRNEVNLLQMELDTLDVASDQGIVGIAPPPGAPLQGIPIGPRASTELPTGMNETLRRALQGLGNQSPDKPRTERSEERR